MDFQSAMETFAEAWMAANTKSRPDSSDPQREGSAERTNGRSEEVTPREPAAHLTNGDSPNRQSPVLLARDPEGSPKPLSVGKNIPLHVVIETIPLCGVGMGIEELRGRVEMDSYALIPGHTRFTDLLQSALVKLGYSEELTHARGLLQLRNWRPLPLEHIPETEDKTVAEVLCDVAPLATLHVRIYSPWKVRCARDIKDRLLRLLLQQSHHLLVSSGCPLDESLLSALIRGSGEVSEESARQFEAWWAVHVAHVSRPPPSAHVMTPPHHVHARPHSIEKMQPEPLHPAIQTVTSQYGPQKTRMRTSFDPELELPRLQRWFAENQHPTRLQIQQYVAELNALESRRGRKPLDVSNVVYWFKNARAAYKRQEFRSFNGLKSPPPDETSVSDNDEHHDPYPPTSHPPHALPPHSPPTPHDHIQQQQQQHQQQQQQSQHEENQQQQEDEEPGPPGSEPCEGVQGRSQGAGGSSGALNTTGERCPPESDVDMSEDEDDVRSRDSVSATIEGKCSPPPVVSPGALSLPPYPPLPGLQPGMDRLPYPVVPGSLLQHSMMYMAHYMPQRVSFLQVSPFSSGLGSSGPPEERRKRNRTFIDPVTEVPRLEQWFAINTHPSHNLILKYTEELNRMPYRQKFPKLEPKNVQFWFKNRRAKCKRLRVSI
ncbi:homeobox protein dve-1-like isoform X2 [Homarus americanus]|uniref:homeobox protein dve-1-like isoform X2 n=1 Tax=Homarus americanus TaxID=6706 RepID=UPI001C485309|nr:homeobox protein dve-1-like isoform X2 [Homarus americanus]